MIRLLLVSFLLLTSVSLFSQEKKFSLGFSGGTTFSSARIENYMSGDYSFSLGFTGELYCIFSFNSHFFLLTDVGIQQRGYDYHYESPLLMMNVEMENSYHGLEFKTDHIYLNNDWLIGYQFGNEMNVSISSGIFYSYYLSSILYDRNYIYIDPVDHDLIGDFALPIGYSENEKHSKRRDQNISDWDLGIIGSISLGYMINERYTISISGKYYHSLYNISKIEFIKDVCIYNRSIVTSVGINRRF